MKLNAEARSCTGSLALHPRSRDIKLANFSITFHGCELVQDTMLELNCGRRYGLIGLNGSGNILIFYYEIVVQLFQVILENLGSDPMTTFLGTLADELSL